VRKITTDVCLLSALLSASATSLAQTYQNFDPPAGLPQTQVSLLSDVNWNREDLFQADWETDRVTSRRHRHRRTSPVTSFLSLDPLCSLTPHGPHGCIAACRCGSLSSFTDDERHSTGCSRLRSSCGIDHQTMRAGSFASMWFRGCRSVGYQHAIYSARKM